MAEAVRRLADWNDLLALGEDCDAEVIDGVVVHKYGDSRAMSPRPAASHGFVQAALSARLFPSFVDDDSGEPGGWWLIIEPDIELDPHRIVSPDVVGWRRQRTPAFPADRPIAATPDWVCEVLSPSTAQRDRTTKAELYLHAGIGHFWLLDPQERTLEALASERGRWVRLGAFAGTEPVRIAPFEAIELRVDRLFPPPAAK